MAHRQPHTPPPEALPDGEAVPFLAKFKTALCKQWSMSSSSSLADMAGLATYLWALDRPAEGLAVAEAVAVAVPAPVPLPSGGFHMDNWCEAANCHALVVRLGRQSRPDLAAASLAALLAEPGVSRDNPEYLAQQVTEAREAVDAAPSRRRLSRPQLGCLAGLVTGLVMFEELASAGDDYFAPFAVDAPVLVPQLLERLAAEVRRA